MAGWTDVGKVGVRVVPNTNDFRSQLKKGLDRIERSTRVNIGMKLDTKGFSESVKAAVKAAQASAGDIKVTTDLDAAKLASQARAAAASAGENVKLGIDVDAEKAKASAHHAAGKIKDELDGIPATITINQAGFIAAARSAAAVAGAGLRVTARLTLDSRGFAASLATAKVASEFFGASLLQHLVSLPKFVGMISAATVAVGGLSGPLVAVGAAAVSALTPMIGLSAAMIPSAIGSMAMAIGVLKTSFNGFGEALKAESLDEFNAAIQDMPPAVQAGAKAVYGLKEQFSSLGEEIGTHFWKNLSNLGDLGVLVAPIGKAMNGLAADMGNAAAGVVDFVSQGVGLSAMKSVILGSSSAASSLSYAFADVVKGAIAVGASAAPLFADLAEKMSDMASTWANKVTDSFRDGSMQEYFSRGVAEAKQLWSVMRQLGSIIGGVFSAISAAGQPFLGTLGQIITKTDEWVNSVQGQTALVGFFSSMGDAMGTILPIVTQLAGIIGTTLAPAISGFIQEIGPGLSAVVDGLGAGLAAIAPAVAPLGAAFGSVLAAISPLLPAIGAMVGSIGGALATAVSGAVPMISALAGVFSAIAPVIGTIAEVLGTVLAAAFQAIAPWTQMFAQVMQQLAPLLQEVALQLGGMLTQAVQMLAPFIPQLAEAFMQILQALMPLVPIILQLAATLIGALLPVITALMPVIVSLIQIIANIVTALMPIIVIVARVISVFVQLLAVIVGFVGSALGMILSFVAGVISGFASMVASVIGSITGFVSGIVSRIASMASSVMSTVSSMWGRVVSAFSQGVSQAVSWVGRLPGMAVSALGNLGSLLVGSGRALVQGFIDGIMAMVGAVANAAKSVVSAARNFFPFSPAKEGPFSGHGWVLYSGRSIGAAFAQGIQDSAGAADLATKRMMGTAQANLNGFKTDIFAYQTSRDSGAGVDTSIHIGSLVAADMDAPLREIRTMQLRAQIRAGMA